MGITEPLAWANSTLLKGDLADAVAGLKQREGDLLSSAAAGWPRR
jgi:hypothetical protein